MANGLGGYACGTMRRDWSPSRWSLPSKIGGRSTRYYRRFEETLHPFRSILNPAFSGISVASVATAERFFEVVQRLGNLFCQRLAF